VKREKGRKCGREVGKLTRSAGCAVARASRQSKRRMVRMWEVSAILDGIVEV
jgi:Holliday junction resolvase